jgi:DNA repair exonuclease SbcCD ATPase subunit
MRVRLIADLHLHEWREFASVTEIGLNTRLVAQVESFKRLCQHVVPGTKRPSTLVLAGDLVDKRGALSHQVLWALEECLGEADRAFEKVAVIPGNHDFALKQGPAWLHALTAVASQFESVEVFNFPGVTRCPGGLLAMVPWMPDKEAFTKGIEAVAKEVDGNKSSLLVTHVAVTGATGDNGWTCTEGVSLAQLKPEAFGGVFLGDFHSTQQLASNVWYIGSPMAHSFGDNHATAAKGALDVEVTTKSLALEFVPSGAPLFIRTSSIEEAREQMALGNFVRFMATGSEDALEAEELGLAVEFAPPPKTSSRLSVAPGSSPIDVLEAWLAKQKSEETWDLKLFPVVEDLARGVIAEVGSTVSERGGLLQLESLEASNFMGYEKLGVGLKDRGIVLLEGDNLDTATAKSNGSGKSTLVEAVVYALFGSVLRDDVPVSGLLKVGAKAMSVELTAMVEGGRALKIKRSRTKSGGTFEWWLDGKPQAAADPKEGQRELERVTGWSMELFKQAAVFGQGVDRLFSTATDSERKELLESLCSGDRFDPLLTKAKENFNFTSTVLAGKQRELEALHRSMEDLTREIEEAGEKSAQFSRNQQDRSDQFKKSMEAADAEASELEATLQLKQQETEKFREEVGSCGELSSEAQELRDKAEAMGDLASEETKAHRAELEKDTQVRQLKRDWNAAVDQCQDVPVGGEVCTQCEQKISGKHAEKVKAERKQKEEKLKADLVAAEKEFQSLRKQSAEAVTRTEQQRELRKEADRIEAQFNRNLKALSDQLSQMELALERLEDRVKAKRDEAKRLGEQSREALQAENTWGQIVEGRKTRLAEVEGKVPDLQEEVKFLSSILPAMEYVVKLFGTQGLKTFLFDTLAPSITEKANEALQTLSDGALKVTVGTAGNGQRQQITMEVVNELGAPCFGGNSGGEKRKVDLALCWAISSLVESRINVLFIDEAFDALDTVAGHRVVKLLESRQRTRGTIINMTHKEGFKEYFETVWTARRKGRTSELVTAGS